MADLLRSGMARLSALRKQHLSHAILYRPLDGAAYTVEEATIGRSFARGSEEYGITTRTRVRDYLIDAADMAAEPQPGDHIIDDNHIFEVQPVGDDDAWRWTDGYHRTYRIHTLDRGPS